MSILVHGVDLIDLEAFKLTFEDVDAMKSCFTDSELKDIGGDVHSLERAAGRFAIKESVLKSLGLGEDIALTDVEVITNSCGAPSVNLSGEVKAISVSQGVVNWFVSSSHDGEYAMASAIGVS